MTWPRLDGVRQSLEPGQNVISYGVDRNVGLGLDLDLDEALPGQPA
ncbi:hypothetical protein ABZX90_26015 [Streptomyces sp. NPDC002935]